MRAATPNRPTTTLRTPARLPRLCGSLALAPLCVWLLSPATSHAAVPPPEKLLPEDTLVLLTAPDFSKLAQVWQKSPQLQFWNDPALRPFREKFLAGSRENFLQPLEREMNINLASYATLLQGQVTLAVTQNGWQGQEDQPLGFLLLVDARDKVSQLTTNLTRLRQKWVEAGKPVRAEKIRGYDFIVLPMGNNEVPGILRQFFPRSLPVRELGAEESPKPAPAKNEVVVGQAGSLLLLANSMASIEKVLVHLTGGAMPSLGELAAYDANYQPLFRAAPLYGWVNLKAITDVLNRRAAAQKPSNVPRPVEEIRADKFIGSSGLGGVRTLAFSVQDAGDGLCWQFLASVPESDRVSLVQVLPGEAKEWNAPTFVPADAVRFQRWRLDGRKACLALEQILAASTPASLNGLRAIINTAHDAAKLKTPEFDLRAAFLASLGDDIIRYEKAPAGTSPEELDAPPALLLLGSPNPDQLAVCLKWMLVVLSDTPAEREFLGRKVYSAPMPPLPFLVSDAARSATPRTLHFAATSSYVALSTEVSLVEEFLRSPESSAKALRETPGLAEAAQKVVGPGTSLFGYINRAQTTRANLEALRSNPAATNSITLLGTLPAIFGLTTPEKSCQEWMNFSLLPPFDQVSKYFNFTVYGVTANMDGVSLKFFAPTPPQLRPVAAPPPKAQVSTNSPP